MISLVDCYEREKASLQKWRNAGIALFFVSSFFATVLPSKSDMLFIVGGAAAIKIASDQQVQDTARKALDWVGAQIEVTK